MSERQDGGPAFGHVQWDSHLHRPHHIHGMSLRDWFAGQALVSIGTNVPEGYISGDDAVVKAQEAYRIADAMIKQRESS